MAPLPPALSLQKRGGKRGPRPSKRLAVGGGQRSGSCAAPARAQRAARLLPPLRVHFLRGQGAFATAPPSHLSPSLRCALPCAAALPPLLPLPSPLVPSMHIARGDEQRAVRMDAVGAAGARPQRRRAARHKTTHAPFSLALAPPPSLLLPKAPGGGVHQNVSKFVRPLFYLHTTPFFTCSPPPRPPLTCVDHYCIFPSFSLHWIRPLHSSLLRVTSPGPLLRRREGVGPWWVVVAMGQSVCAVRASKRRRPSRVRHWRERAASTRSPSCSCCNTYRFSYCFNPHFSSQHHQTNEQARTRPRSHSRDRSWRSPVKKSFFSLSRENTATSGALQLMMR